VGCHACVQGRDRHALITRHLRGRVDISPHVKSGVYWTRFGRTQQIGVRVTVKTRTRGVVGHRYTVTVQCRSSHNPAKLDAVRIVVRVVR